MKGILVEKLPKTFQDAISITRKLNIPYIWIDSLCIVQDDNEDWQEQASQMMEVYRSAYITIAATASRDDEQGMFMETRRPVLAQKKFLFNNGDCDVAIWFREQLPHPDQFHKEQDYGDSMPLMTRAWVFQERLLSRRYLHFGEHELLWECLEEVDCECNFAGRPFLLNNLVLSTFWNSFPTKMNFTNADKLKQQEIRPAWRSIVERYTDLRLTIQRDRLPALSGVAKVFKVRYTIKRIMQGEYIG